MILGGCYSLWLFNRIAYGNLKTQYITKFIDLNKREFYIFVPLILGTILMGLYPKIFLDPIHLSVNLLLQWMKF
jgi:NADH:ubiquinone oxidoreductase subunit 4 (subunit M)